MSKRYVAVLEKSGVVLPTTYSYRYFDTSKEAFRFLDRQKKTGILERRYIVDRKIDKYVILPGCMPYNS